MVKRKGLRDGGDLDMVDASRRREADSDSGSDDVCGTLSGVLGIDQVTNVEF
jgi:hypothetical protein